MQPTQQVIANSLLGTSKSVRTYTHNEEAQLVSEDLELFLGAINNQDSIAHYLIDRSYDLSGNLLSLQTRGGFPLGTMAKVAKDNVTSYKAKYLAGTATLENLIFMQNGVEISTPLQGLSVNAEGYITSLSLENNLEMNKNVYMLSPK
jgi:hypothetical protein